MIRVASLEKSFVSYTGAAVHALQGVSFETTPGEFYTLLGPSGCGKTTTLRSIAGFENPDVGEIMVGDQLVFSGARHVNITPARRNFGIVFQSYAIWPHMTVFDNVAFPLVHGRKKISRAAARDRVERVLSLVQLDELAERPAPFLSGGQQQRVALARALVHEPEVLLLDEPLSNLDAKLREDMRLEIRELVKRLNITTLYVTHDQLEALTMSDRVAVMNAGKIVQEGAPVEIYKAPRDEFVAHFIGQANFIEGTVAEINGAGLGSVSTKSGTIQCDVQDSMKVGDAMVLMIRPEDIEICGAGEQPDGNTIEAEVQAALFAGEVLDCWLTTSDGRLRIKTHTSVQLSPGDRARLYLSPDRCRAIPAAP
jgi:iron(III) transport system ATP-binding protein